MNLLHNFEKEMTKLIRYIEGDKKKDLIQLKESISKFKNQIEVENKKLELQKLKDQLFVELQNTQNSLQKI